MKKMLRLFVFITVFMSVQASAQSVSEHRSLHLSASVSVSPSAITLSWRPLTNVFVYPDSVYNLLYIYRKAKSDIVWGNPVARIYAMDSTYVDSDVTADSAYEYRIIRADSVRRNCSNPGDPADPAGTGQDGDQSPPKCDTYNVSRYAYPFGYIYAGIRAPAIHHRGTLLLLADSLFSSTCSTEIRQLMADINGDGWGVLLHNGISRSLKDTSIRSLIRDYYISTGGELNAVLLLGHIAVPYSGNFAPDGHDDHIGAWPSDIFYSDTFSLSGGGPLLLGWTDSSVHVNDPVVRPVNRNIPGDGKWDQSFIVTPGGGKRIQVSRIDFANMSFFNKTETELMQQYLRRAHLYKTDSILVKRRALLGDNFTEHEFAKNGWLNFSPLVGRDRVKKVDFISSLHADSYQWAYGCGGGQDTLAGGIGTTRDFTTNQVNGIFTMLFGSYFGDWNTENNFLRAPLCSDVPALTSCWGGNPDWYFHHMALGEHIGYSTMLMFSSFPAYYRIDYEGFGTPRHGALMGDLTLRTDYVRQPTGFTATAIGTAGKVVLSWQQPGEDDLAGYYVYRSTQRYGKYELVSPLLNAFSHVDVYPGYGWVYYMLRPVRVEETPSGTYYNPGVGVVDSVYFSGGSEESKPSGIDDADATWTFHLYPNPVGGHLNLEMNSNYAGAVTYQIVDVSGSVVFRQSGQVREGKNSWSVQTGHLSPGVYMLRINTNGTTGERKFIKL